MILSFRAALVTRQFVEVNRIRIEVIKKTLRFFRWNFDVLISINFLSRFQGMLAAFPKLMGTDSKQQHTFVETEAVR